MEELGEFPFRSGWKCDQTQSNNSNFMMSPHLDSNRIVAFFAPLAFKSRFMRKINPRRSCAASLSIKLASIKIPFTYKIKELLDVSFYFTWKYGIDNSLESLMKNYWRCMDCAQALKRNDAPSVHHSSCVRVGERANLTITWARETERRG